MKQIYHPYTNWECFKNGMWNKLEAKEETEMLQIAIEFTGDYVKYGKAMLRAINEWPISCEHHLTDISINRKAYIGHCAVCLELGIPEYITRKAWGYLTQEQQDKANKQAENAIKQYEATYKKVHKDMGGQVLLFGNP